VEKFRSAITQASESLGTLRSTASETAAKKYEIAATRWAANVDPDAEAMQLQRVQPLIPVAKLMHGIGMDVTSAFELESDDDIVAALSRASSVSSIDSWTSRSGFSSANTSGTTTPSIMEDEDGEDGPLGFGPESPSIGSRPGVLSRSRGSRGSLTSMGRGKKPHPLTKARSDLASGLSAKLEPFSPPLSASESGKVRKLEAIPSLARPAPFFRTLTAGASVQSSGTPSSGNTIADFKSSRDTSATSVRASSSPTAAFKRAPFRRSKTKPDILAQDASGKLFTAGSASILERETVENTVPSISPRNRAVQFDQTAVLEPRASVRLTGKAGANANSDISDILDLDYGSEIPTPASSPDTSPPSSGLQTPESARISSNVAGGLSADALAEAATRMSRQSSVSSLHAVPPGRLSRSSSHSSIGNRARRTYPAVERLSRAGSLNTIDMGLLGSSSSRSGSSMSLKRSDSDLSIHEALVAVRSFVGVALHLAQALFELSQIQELPLQPVVAHPAAGDANSQLREASILCWRINRLLDALPELKKTLANAKAFSSTESDSSIELKLPNTRYKAFFGYLKGVNLLHAAICNARAAQIAKSPFDGVASFSSCRTPLSDSLVAQALRSIDDVRIHSCLIFIS
jgi:hypothetical protein